MSGGSCQEPNPGLDRVRYMLRAAGVRSETPNPRRSGIHTRGYLPHVKREGASYFVTFRLADALPQETLLRFEAEKAERLRRLPHPADQGQSGSASEAAIHREFLRRVERYLDRGHGACHLNRPEVAELVSGALRYFEDERYRLDEWVVMPNHVHAVVWPAPNQTLSEILKSWKQFTSRRAKRMLALCAEPFWQRESYDHWIRNDAEKARIRRYIRNNPVIAGLCSRAEDWRWSSAWQGNTSGAA